MLRHVNGRLRVGCLCVRISCLCVWISCLCVRILFFVVLLIVVCVVGFCDFESVIVYVFCYGYNFYVCNVVWVVVLFVVWD